MGPKRNKEKGKKKVEKKKESEVIQSGPAYERWLTDQMRQLAKMESLTQRLNNENKALRNEIQRIEEDRKDIVAFLRRLLGEKCEEVEGLGEINKALESEIAAEMANFNEEMNSKRAQSSEVIDHLQLEIDELHARLNNVSEYKEQRDILLDKTNKLGMCLEIMVVRGDLIERQFEKVNSILKENMRKEIEYNLQVLSKKIHRAAKDQIAVATQKIIKENVSLNNELSLLIASWQKLHDDNEQIQEDNRHVQNELDLEKATREKLMTKNTAQDEMIGRLTREYLRVDELHKEADLLRRISDNLQDKINEKERARDKAASECLAVEKEVGDLRAQINGLQEDSKTLERVNELNSNLILNVRQEVGDIRRDLDNRQKRGSISAEELLREYEEMFNRLFELFDEDWLLDWSGEALQSLSLPTVLGVMP